MAYTDWTPILEMIQGKKDSSILEFGCGQGTKALVDNFKKVFSFEIQNDRFWFDKTVNDLQGRENYQYDYVDAPELFAEHDEFTKSERPNHLGRNFQAIRPARRLLEILEKSKERIPYKDFDGFFVDAGLYLRGEMVNFVLQFEPKFIMVHDTNGFADYGYNLVNTEDYFFFHFATEDGTGMYLKKERNV